MNFWEKNKTRGMVKQEIEEGDFCVACQYIIYKLEEYTDMPQTIMIGGKFGTQDCKQYLL